jgi:7-cyano-7-deazaguanine synthase
MAGISENPDRPSNSRRPAVVLLSGGLDSATCLAIAIREGFEPHAISFAYGQRHTSEIAAARRVAEKYRVADHRVIDIDLRQFGGSALTDAIAVPKGRDEADMAGDIPVTYVPARNTIFLAYALAFAEVLDARDIYIGVNALDYSGYPDCRGEYIAAFQAMAGLATKAGVEGRPVQIRTPLIDWPKDRIIQEGLALGVDYGLTHSCYDPTDVGLACGQCDSCRLRRAAFDRIGTKDPIPYAE